ncbi:MAG: hypothetical protein HQ547_00305 [Candidatus Omnitrophica bacterium]|nr:hypothetical protein [Candidatus Omnitrophota bacterium]
MLLSQKKNKGFTQPLRAEAGFMLLEVIMSVLIIASGIIFVVRAYSTSLKATETARVLTKACFLLEEKLLELDIEGFKEGVEEGESSTTIEEEQHYRCNLAVWPLDDEEGLKMNKVNLSVEYRKGNQGREATISTFRKSKEG